jgi:hypothetical protein
MSHVFTPRRHTPPSPGTLAALDFGLRVRVDIHPAQLTIFSGAEELPVHELTSELAELVSHLRVRSFALRHELEQATSALQVNVDCAFWTLAQTAALDLAALLREARRRHLADPELSLRAANAAVRIADLCSREVR